MEALENGLLQIPPRSLGFGHDQQSSTTAQRKPGANSNGNGAGEYPEAATEIENGVHQLETLLESTVDKAFDYFEIWTLSNVLTIPDDLAMWMRLGHYEVRKAFRRTLRLLEKAVCPRPKTLLISPSEPSISTSRKCPDP